MGREQQQQTTSGKQSAQPSHRISRFQNGYIYSSEGGAVVGPNYTFRLEKLIIQKTRAWHEDDDAVSFSLKIGDHIEAKTTFLEGLNDGEHHIGLSIGPVFIGYNQPPIAFNYVIANAGGNSTGEEAVRKANEVLFNEFKEHYTTKKPSDDESPSRADMASETDYARADGGLIVLGATIAWEALSTALEGGGCNGLVATDQVTVGGNALARWTDETGEHREEKFHPGRNSRDLCGGNSKYLVTWSIARQ